MNVKLFAMQGDPDTQRALNLLQAAQIECELIDVERTGVIAFLERDLDVKELPFLIVPTGKIEGLKAIECFLSARR